MKHTEPQRFSIDRYLAGELNENEARLIKEHMEGCEICSQYYQNLKKLDEEFLGRYPFSLFENTNLDTNDSFVNRNNFFGQSLSRPLLVPAFVFLLMIVVITPLMVIKQGNVDDHVTFKGKHVLSFLCKRDGIVRKGELSETYYCNDQIQIIYNSSKEQYITLFSIDSKGTVSFYHSDRSSDDCSIVTPVGSGLTYPGSIVLDSVPGYELIAAVFSKNPLKVSQIENWVKDLKKNYTDMHELQQQLENASFGRSTTVATLLLKKK